MSKCGRPQKPEELKLVGTPVQLPPDILLEINNYITESDLKKSAKLREWLIKGYRLERAIKLLDTSWKSKKDELEEQQLLEALKNLEN